MPLPKTESIETRATELYANLIQHVLKLQSSDPSSRDPDEAQVLQSHLPYLRQLLTCCACGGLLKQATVSPGCDHYYCSSCKSCAPLWRITCRQCRERTDLAHAYKMQTLVDCYRCMCHLIRTFYSIAVPESREQNCEDDFDPVSELLSEVETGRKCSLKILKIKPPKELLLKEPPPAVSPVSQSSLGPAAEISQEVAKVQTPSPLCAIRQDSPVYEGN